MPGYSDLLSTSSHRIASHRFVSYRIVSHPWFITVFVCYCKLTLKCKIFMHIYSQKWLQYNPDLLCAEMLLAWCMEGRWQWEYYHCLFCSIVIVAFIAIVIAWTTSHGQHIHLFMYKHTSTYICVYVEWMCLQL